MALVFLGDKEVCIPLSLSLSPLSLSLSLLSLSLSISLSLSLSLSLSPWSTFSSDSAVYARRTCGQKKQPSSHASLNTFFLAYVVCILQWLTITPRNLFWFLCFDRCICSKVAHKMKWNIPKMAMDRERERERDTERERERESLKFAKIYF